MKGRLHALAACTGLLLLTGCAATPEVDLDAARDWLEMVQAEESDGPGAAGIASLLIAPESSDSTDDGVRLDFDMPTQLVRADARCFGGGTADVTVTVTSADGAGTESFDADVPCDREPHPIDLESGPAAAAAVEASGSAETYLHVTLIQEMIVER